MRFSGVGFLLSIGCGAAVTAILLAAGGGEATTFAAIAGLCAALVCMVAGCMVVGWLWPETHQPPRPAARPAPPGVAPPARNGPPVPVYAARVVDLGPGDFLRIECTCGRAEVLTAASLKAAGIAPKQRMTEVGSRMRCDDCVARGGTVVSVRRGKLASKPLPA